MRGHSEKHQCSSCDVYYDADTIRFVDDSTGICINCDEVFMTTDHNTDKAREIVCIDDTFDASDAELVRLNKQ